MTEPRDPAVPEPLQRRTYQAAALMRQHPGVLRNANKQVLFAIAFSWQPLGGDNGIHAVCCGPNTWNAVKGSGTVMINGKPAHRMGDTDQHCGGVGQMIEGSADVIIGG